MGNTKSAPRRGRGQQLSATRKGPDPVALARLDPSIGIDLDAYSTTGTPYERNAICDSAALCDEKAMVELLQNGGVGVDVNGLSEEGETALHISTRRGHLRMMELLLQAGARVNATDRYGFTPLHHAIQCDLYCARILVDQHFQPRGNVAASVSMIAASNEALMSLLLDHGADPMAASFDGTTCVHYAIQSRRIAACALLMRIPTVSLLTSTVFCETPLHSLARLGVVNMLDAALKSEFYFVKREKHQISADMAAFSTCIIKSVGSSLPLMSQVLSRRKRTDETNKALMLPLVRPLIPSRYFVLGSLSPRNPHEVMLLKYICWVTSDLKGAPVLMFPIAPSHREVPTLCSMVSSDRFRYQGLLAKLQPSPPLPVAGLASPPSTASNQVSGAVPADMVMSLWTGGRLMEDERSYTVEVSKIVRARTGRLLSKMLPRPADLVSSPTGLSGGQLSTSMLTFDLFHQLLDAYENESIVDDEPRRDRSAVGDGSDEQNMLTPTATARSTQVGISPSMTTASSSSTPSSTMRLRDKMQLLYGDDNVSVPSNPPRFDSTRAREVSCPTDRVAALIPYPSAQTVPHDVNPSCRLDMVVQGGPDAGKTPLSFCNNDQADAVVAPLSEKRCVLLLLSTRAQLLLEETFGIPMIDNYV